MSLQPVSHEVSAAEAGRLDRIVRSMTGRSWGEVRGLIQQGRVEVDGICLTDPGANVDTGQTVVVTHDPGTKYRERPSARGNSAFRVVFEDSDLIVVDKAAHLLTVPTRKGERNTLVEGVTQHVRRGGGRTAIVIHRLDRGTSGLLVFAKTERVADALREQFRLRKSEREYLALVAGAMEDEAGTFHSRLGTSKSLQRHSVDEGEEGEEAITHWTVRRRLRGATFVSAQLETGRRNQIRVQFAEAGHPVLGDERYEPEQARHPRWKARRLALHAATLGLIHPRTGAVLRFESPLPAEFERFLA